MSVSANPYACPLTPTHATPSLSSQLLFPLPIMGMMASGFTIVGAAARIIFILYYQETWKTPWTKIEDALPIFGLLVFGVTAGCLLLATSPQRPLSQRDAPLCQAFISLAIFAILLRVLSESTAAWYMNGTSLILTLSAGVAMIMVFRRIRSEYADARPSRPHHLDAQSSNT